MNTSTKAEHFLDITEFVCPMTFVHTKLLMERLPVGAVAEIRLNAGEPLKNVPRSLKEHGHEILSLTPEPGAGADGPHRLVVRKR